MIDNDKDPFSDFSSTFADLRGIIYKIQNGYKSA